MPKSIVSTTKELMKGPFAPFPKLPVRLLGLLLSQLADGNGDVSAFPL